ncbi:MAG TPA: hypothetical protein VF507_00885 [Pyrinomonadaceae bacterium]
MILLTKALKSPLSPLLLVVALTAASLFLSGAAAQQQVVARLTTRGNQPITVNGASAATGTTLLTGSTIETPDSVGATIDLGPLGTLDLAPNTAVKVDYSGGKVRVTLIRGCLILRGKKNADASVETAQGTAGRNEKSKGGILDVCFPLGAIRPVVNQNAASNAGAGADNNSPDANGNNSNQPKPDNNQNPDNSNQNSAAQNNTSDPPGCNSPRLGHAPKTADGVGRVDARILDQDGSPVKGAKLMLKSMRINGILCESWNTSDQCGQALLPPLHIGPKLTLTVEAKGFQKQLVNVDASSLNQPVEIRLLRKVK